jgi:hypothetical protein
MALEIEIFTDDAIVPTALAAPNDSVRECAVQFAELEIGASHRTALPP